MQSTRREKFVKDPDRPYKVMLIVFYILFVLALMYLDLSLGVKLLYAAIVLFVVIVLSIVVFRKKVIH